MTEQDRYGTIIEKIIYIPRDNNLDSINITKILLGINYLGTNIEESCPECSIHLGTPERKFYIEYDKGKKNVELGEDPLVHEIYDMLEGRIPFSISDIGIEYEQDGEQKKYGINSWLKDAKKTGFLSRTKKIEIPEIFTLKKPDREEIYLSLILEKKEPYSPLEHKAKLHIGIYGELKK